MFLIKKASLVGLFEKGAVYHILSRVCFYACMLLVPLLLIPMSVVTYGGLVLREQYCAMFTTATWVAIFFAVANFFLSIALTYLFVAPLLENARRVRKGNSHLSRFVHKVAVRNSMISFVAVIINCSSCLLQAIVFSMNQTDDTQQYALVIVGIVVIFEMSWMGWSVKAMTNVWLPRRFKSAPPLQKAVTKKLSASTDIVVPKL
jgi:hypothetical protein